MSYIWNKLTKKSFPLEFRTVEVPTSSEICDAISKYAGQCGATVRFLSTTMPIRFTLDGVAYAAKRGRGFFYYPTVRCVEE